MASIHEQRNPENQARQSTAQFYNKDIIDDITPARRILEQYSGIPPEQVVPHIHAIRAKAWQIFPYPCIGRFRFLDLSISRAPLYPTIIRRLQSGDTFLDMGCCFGQDIRSLVMDGAQPDSLSGTDLIHEYLDLGYELFQDRDTLKAHFFAADALDEESVPLKELEGKIDIIHAASFLHLFGWDDQVALGIRMVRILKPKAGSLVLGRHMANTNEQELALKDSPKGIVFMHNNKSFQRMWTEIARKTGAKLQVNVKLGSPQDWGKVAGKDKLLHDPDVRTMRFEIHRLE
ncbi:MAG: hypothetical protein M1834_006849 [Cirrosporium novae-zelandiae]|nr:MAG: hypothetical protein M1834_006849 [Cirrosporium novae-zelandiae]